MTDDSLKTVFDEEWAAPDPRLNHGAVELHVGDGQGQCIPWGYQEPDDGEEWARARLAAAAPDLYRALANAVEHWSEPPMWHIPATSIVEVPDYDLIGAVGPGHLHAGRDASAVHVAPRRPRPSLRGGARAMILPVVRLCAFWTIMNAQPLEPPDPQAWRIYESPSLHVGIRPAASWGEGVGLMVQVSWQ